MKQCQKISLTQVEMRFEPKSLCLKAHVSKCQTNTSQILFKIECHVPRELVNGRFWFSRAAVGSKILIYSKFPGVAEACGPWVVL